MVTWDPRPVFAEIALEPEIAELKFNAVDASRMVDQVVMSRDELQNGIVVVRGRADVPTGQIGAVEYSLDGGRTWAQATLGDRGYFTFEFRPQFERQYTIAVVALTTTGHATRQEDHQVKFEVKASNAVEEARQAFLKILDAYSRESRSEFMRAVSDDFEGSLAALDEAVRNDFRNFDNIQIQPNITRITTLGEKYEVYFTFNRSLYGVRNGRPLRDSAASAATFKRDGGTFKLIRLSAPLIFGVSNRPSLSASPS